MSKLTMLLMIKMKLFKKKLSNIRKSNGKLDKRRQMKFQKKLTNTLKKKKISYFDSHNFKNQQFKNVEYYTYKNYKS